MKTLQEAMCSQSSWALVDLCPGREYKTLFLNAVNGTPVYSVFSSEFAVKVHFANVVGFGKSVVLSQMLGSACHYSMTEAKICKLMCLAVL